VDEQITFVHPLKCDELLVKVIFLRFYTKNYNFAFYPEIGKCSGYHPVSKSRFRKKKTGHNTSVQSTIDKQARLLYHYTISQSAAYLVKVNHTSAFHYCTVSKLKTYVTL